jgi:hypothetical protein
VSEDDVLFADDLPTFGGTLSLEESEALLSYLTVPYCRVPLVCGFFAARDRSAYLMNGDLQALFTAVLFEGGAWVDPRAKPAAVASVPLRCYGGASGGFESGGGGSSGGVGGRGERDWTDVDDAPLHAAGSPHLHDLETSVTQGKGAARPEAALGTSFGLLLNELDHSPEAVLAPLMTIFKVRRSARAGSLCWPLFPCEEVLEKRSPIALSIPPK